MRFHISLLSLLYLNDLKTTIVHSIDPQFAYYCTCQILDRGKHNMRIVVVLLCETDIFVVLRIDDVKRTHG
jgi:hypothetical protein